MKKQLAKMIGGRSGLDRMGALTGAGVKHPGEDWAFVRVTKGQGSADDLLKRVRFDGTQAGVLEHELGHVLEALNPELFDRAKAFLKARAGSDRPKLHGKQGRRPVRGWADQFLDWYTGRDYSLPDGKVYGTEITSTALELLIANRRHWGRLEELARVDFEHLIFLLGQLAGT